MAGMLADEVKAERSTRAKPHLREAGRKKGRSNSPKTFRGSLHLEGGLFPSSE